MAGLYYQSLTGLNDNNYTYADEPAITTIVSGLGFVETGKNICEIKSHEFAKIENKEVKILPDSESDLAISWTKGFIAANGSCPSFFRSLERWYNANLSIKGSKMKCQFEGKIRLEYKFRSILKLLEANNFKYTFKVTGSKFKIIFE